MCLVYHITLGLVLNFVYVMAEWNPSITEFTISAVNYYVKHDAANALDVLVPLDVGKHNIRRSKVDIVTKNQMNEDDNRCSVDATFKVDHVDDVYDMYDKCYSGALDGYESEEALKVVSRSHKAFQQFMVLNDALKLQDKAVFGMYVSNVSVFNTERPLKIGDWLDPTHPFLSIGLAMYANEHWASRLCTIGHAIVADQEMYKQQIYAAVIEYEQFLLLKDGDIGRFSRAEFKFYSELRRDKLASEDEFFRKAKVRDLFLDYAPYVVARYRGSKYQDIVSKEIQDWCYKLLRIDSRYITNTVGVRSVNLKRRVFRGRAGVDKRLFKSCMTLFNIIDQDIALKDYYSCLFGVWCQILWGHYVDGILSVTIQGFKVEFKENGDNQFAWGVVRVLIKKGRAKNKAFMYVFLYVT